ncbi:macoilin-1-like isoform X2 [Centruroides sculpturatus]|uniref:macoilin-1-like isoform X2 n=2 Tax=Centruroides sculpturatus TaxID=218467 RepID=UPI000C6E0C78|nr:macoilin-1-like isoform X2 [Centruroides sculpturatus]
MKRRNAECGKIRRAVKRTKIAEGIYGSTFLYLKFLLVWALVLLADFLLEFRFEYLWPFWLLLRSVYDSFKYQGLAFSVFFVFIAFTSDMICFLFIPVHWLFFAASTYVWVQYVWHTERGVCLPTISLWLLFVYIEASVRLKELKNLPFHLDLCRPFAAHCIGYPVVTLGFGFKSYIGYRMRLRKQKEVAKENEFYIQLLQLALPAESPSITLVNSSEKEKGSKTNEEVISNGINHCNSNQSHAKKSTSGGSLPNTGGGKLVNQNQVTVTSSATINSTYSEVDMRDFRKHNNASHIIDRHEYQYMEHHLIKQQASVNTYEDSDESCEQEKTSFKVNDIAICSSPSARGSSSNKWDHHSQTNSVKDNLTNQQTSNSRRNRSNSSKEMTANNLNAQKDEHTLRLESDIKRLKADLQASRQCEQELRVQIHNLTVGERSVKNEFAQLQQDNENLQNKLHNLVTARQQDKATISQLEKKLQDERKLRTLLEGQLANERKAKKAEEAAAARAVAMAAARTECTDSCKMRRRDLENDIKQMRRELKLREEQLHQVEREAQSLRQYKDSHGDTEVLMSALSAMQDKNTHLETNLSAETRLKLDLFSALGEAKRQLEITQAMIVQKDKEIDELKSKIAEVMAVMPVTSTNNYPPPAITLASGIVSSLLYSPKFHTEEKVTKSTLDPNASVYTPKVVPSDM